MIYSPSHTPHQFSTSFFGIIPPLKCTRSVFMPCSRCLPGQVSVSQRHPQEMDGVGKIQSHFYIQLPSSSDGKESACKAEARFDPWVGEILWRREWQPTPVFLPGESHGRRSLVGYSSWGRRESDTTERPSTHSTLNYKSLEKCKK